MVRKIETTEIGSQDRPKAEVKIADCTVRVLEEPLAVARDDAVE